MGTKTCKKYAEINDNLSADFGEDETQKHENRVCSLFVRLLGNLADTETCPSERSNAEPCRVVAVLLFGA